MADHGRRYLPAIVLAVAAATPIAAAPNPAGSLIAAEDAYTRAVVGRDIAALARTLSDDLVYVHASGVAQDKEQYLKGTVDGGFRVVGIRITERRASVFGPIGITLGKVAYDVGSGEKPAGYMAVYRRERGRWLLLRWQNARLSSAQ